jgi:hypothetical protein
MNRAGKNTGTLLVMNDWQRPGFACAAVADPNQI